MKHIGILPNLMKDKDLKVTHQIVEWLQSHGVTAYLNEELMEIRDLGAVGVSETDMYNCCEAIIVIGGDGTILGVAEESSRRGIPVLGVNLGRLGFLADIEPYEIEEALEKLIIKEEYIIEERMMLRATILGEDGACHVFHALNDVNVTRGNFSRLVEFEICINEELSDIYPADGVIVATPTGSTAYNLSAGGPIVVPHANTYVVTPICPHTIYSKSVMLCDKDTVLIKTLEETEDMALSLDGKLKMYLTSQDEVRIEKSPYVMKLMKVSERKFFEILREKIVERRR